MGIRRKEVNKRKKEKGRKEKKLYSDQGNTTLHVSKQESSEEETKKQSTYVK